MRFAFCSAQYLRDSFNTFVKDLGFYRIGTAMQLNKDADLHEVNIDTDSFFCSVIQANFTRK